MVDSGRAVERASQVLRELLAIETVIPPGKDYRLFADSSSRLLMSAGMDVEIREVPRSVVSRYNPEYADYPRYIVLAKVGSGHPVIHLNGHYDVVPEGHGWTKSPFSPTVLGGRVYGRGASDMKGGITSITLAMESLADSKADLDGTVEVSFTPDEEIGGHAGVEYMLESGFSRPDYALIAEPTGVDKFLIGHKGSFQVLIEVHGKNAHGSMPWRGLNAFEGMVGIASEINRRYGTVIRSRRSKLHYSDQRAAEPTAMFGGLVKGGSQQNLVPAYCAFSVDRRIIPEEDPKQVEQELLDCITAVGKLRRYQEYNIKTRVLNRVEPAATSTQSNFVQKVRSVIASVQGVSPQPEMAVGAMDAGYFIRSGIETVAYGPGELSQAHVADESVVLSDIVSVATVYEKLVAELL